MKPQLIELINSYAAARLSGDSALMQFAAERLASFLDTVEVNSITTTEETENA